MERNTQQKFVSEKFVARPKNFLAAKPQLILGKKITPLSGGYFLFG
jgi:hypothetical protein